MLKFSSQFEKPLNESRVRGIKRKYIEAMEHRGDTVDVLPKEKRGWPLLLGDETDKEVQKEQRKILGLRAESPISIILKAEGARALNSSAELFTSEYALG